MTRAGFVRSWVMACGLMAAGLVLAGCGDDDPCSTVCSCVEREYGDSEGCREECQMFVAETSPSERRSVCEAVLSSEGLSACTDSCQAFGSGGGGGGDCGRAVCDFNWCGTSTENNCPESFRGTGDGCDCGCQWSDPDC